jgi:hypothetical protein
LKLLVLWDIIISLTTQSTTRKHMKYFFGQVPAQDVKMFGDEGLFEYDGDFYYNWVEFGTNPGGADDLVIADTVGRLVPVSIEHIGTLIEVLEDIQATLDQVKAGKAAEVSIFNPDEIRTFEW